MRTDRRIRFAWKLSLISRVFVAPSEQYKLTRHWSVLTGKDLAPLLKSTTVPVGCREGSTFDWWTKCHRWLGPLAADTADHSSPGRSGSAALSWSSSPSATRAVCPAFRGCSMRPSLSHLPPAGAPSATHLQRDERREPSQQCRHRRWCSRSTCSIGFGQSTSALGVRVNK